MQKQKLHFSININASKGKVWNTMLQDATYWEWTAPFNPNGSSWYEGEWKQGSKMLFLGAGENGKVEGMVSRIKEARPHDFVSIEHLGVVQDGKEDTTSDAARQFAPALENYTFIDKEGMTEVRVEMDSAEEHRQMFEASWPKALQQLKQLAEK
ncbi:MAG: SRPBCC domain-containing protein [Vicinamibacterales bacterium]